MFSSSCSVAKSILSIVRFFILMSFMLAASIACQSSKSDEQVVLDPLENLKEDNLDAEMVTYREWFDSFEQNEQDTLLTNLATYITRKPATAQTISKFDPMYRSYYVKKRAELEFLFAEKIDGNLYFYLLRKARDANGIQQRGVGGVFEYGEKGEIINFEELFNTRILDKGELERAGLEFMRALNDDKALADFIADQRIIEWPDGRLFYSKEKHEWRYVE